MFNSIKKKVAHYRYALLERRFTEIKMLQAKQLILANTQRTDIKSLQDVEFTVFAQSGDDGIIQYLISRIPVSDHIFIEFGVENYRESNTRFLLMNDNWMGLVIDGSNKHINTIRSEAMFSQYELYAEEHFINAENIDNLIAKHFTGRIGLLSIDIDGNDYWVWRNINSVDPDIVIAEYNALFGWDRAITIPYDPAFYRTKAHYSNLYWGASLPALVHLADQKGYVLAGCNKMGNNAYFVKRDAMQYLPWSSPAPDASMTTIRFRQSRNQAGDLDYLDRTASIALLRGLPVVNVINGNHEQF